MMPQGCYDYAFFWIVVSSAFAFAGGIAVGLLSARRRGE